MTDVRSTAPGSASGSPEPGPLPERLGQRFVLGEMLGRGTCSEVYRAHDLLLDREAAVKIFPVADDPRIEREVRLTASLDHPSLVPVYDVGHDAGRAFVVMALLEGGSLADRLEHGPLGVGDTLLAIASVADGLSHVHRGGVLHRDVTPRNVLFDGDDRAHLSDFGVAFVADAPRITDTGMVVGSAPYLAPEQVRGETVGAPADVYALGLVMIEALTARPAYEGAPLAAARARLERRPEMPPGLEIEVLALLEAMTADDPAHRPTAENVCVGLRRAALAAEAPTPPHAMVPVAGAGTPDATTETMGPLVTDVVLPPEVPGRRRRMAEAGGFMVAASVAAAVLLAGGVVVASAWTVDRVNVASPPAATVPPPTAEVVADPGGGPSIGGGSSSGSDDSDDSDDADDSRSSDDSSRRTQAAHIDTATPEPSSDGGATSSTSATSTSSRTSTTTAPSADDPGDELPGVPSIPVPSVTLPTITVPTIPTPTHTSSTTTPTPTTSSGTTTSSSTTSSTTSATSSSTTTTTTTTPPSGRTRTVLDPAVEALGGLLGR
jgi:eukaryotic-like serine/threonine-protein kinase